MGKASSISFKYGTQHRDQKQHTGLMANFTGGTLDSNNMSHQMEIDFVCESGLGVGTLSYYASEQM